MGTIETPLDPIDDEELTARHAEATQISDITRDQVRRALGHLSSHGVPRSGRTVESVLAVDRLFDEQDSYRRAAEYSKAQNEALIGRHVMHHVAAGMLAAQVVKSAKVEDHNDDLAVRVELAGGTVVYLTAEVSRYGRIDELLWKVSG